MFIQHEIVELLAELVRLESPSRDKAALMSLATRLADRLVQLGATVGIVPNALAGNHVLGRYSHNGKLPPGWFSATSIRSGRVGRSNQCRFGSMKLDAFSARVFST